MRATPGAVLPETSSAVPWPRLWAPECGTRSRVPSSTVAFQQKLVKDNQAAEAQLLSRTVPPARSKIVAPTPEQDKAAVAATLTKAADKKA